MSETFISRIDGSVKNREDYPPTINEGGVLPEGLANIFRAADESTYEKAVQLTIRTLGRDWNIDHNLLVMIAKHFHSVDESDYFIDILDSESWDIDVAWPTYCRNRGIEHEIDCNPFN